MINNNDTKLLINAQKGDRKSFQLLFDKYYQKAVNLSYKITQNLPSAEDIAMDSFLDIYKMNIKEDVNFNAYFMRTVFNNSLNEIKKNNKFTGEFNDDILIRPGLNPETITAKTEEFNDILKKLRKLPENQYKAFILVKYEGYSYNEVAEIMNTTPKAVEGYMFRARKTINKIFNLNDKEERNEL